MSSEECEEETEAAGVVDTSMASTSMLGGENSIEIKLCDDQDEESDSSIEEFAPLLPHKEEVYTIHDLTTSSGTSKVKGWKGLLVRVLNYLCFETNEESYVDYVTRQCNSKAIQKELKTIHDLCFNIDDWHSVISNEETRYIKDMGDCEQRLVEERDRYNYNLSQGLSTAQTLNSIETLAKRRQIMLYHLSEYIRPLYTVIENYKSQISKNIINASFVRTNEGASEVSQRAETIKKQLQNTRELYRVVKPAKPENEENVDIAIFVKTFLSTGKMKDETKLYT